MVDILARPVLARLDLGAVIGILDGVAGAVVTPGTNALQNPDFTPSRT